MDLKRIITQLLGLQDVNIEDVKLYRKDLRAVITARQLSYRTKCRDCGSDLLSAHAWEYREMKAPPLGVFQRVTIKLYYQRGACAECMAVKTAQIPFAHPKFKGMTCGFIETAGRLMEEITCEAVARLLGCNSKTLWSVDQWRMNHMKQHLQLPENLDVTLLSADEVHFKTKRFKKRKGLKAKRWEVQYITNLVCYTNSKVLFNAVGRGTKALLDSLSVLSKGQKLAVEYFAVDMHDPYIAAIQGECPNANICVDRFHLTQQAHKCFDQVRKHELKMAEQNNDRFQLGMLAPSKRFILVERQKHLTKQETRLLEKLRNLNQNIHSSMLIVEYFHRVLDKKTIKSFRQSIAQWYNLIRESGLKVFKKFARQIGKYRKYVEAYIRSHLTTAVSEGLNNKIKVLKRMGYGYHDPESFKNKILQRCGFLNSRYIKTNHLMWHVA